MVADAPLSVGTLVRRHRRAAGLTQEALAERAQVSTPTVSALERGHVPLEDLRNFLHC